MKRTTPGLALCTALLIFFTACAGSSEPADVDSVADGTVDASPGGSEGAEDPSDSGGPGSKGKPKGSGNGDGGAKASKPGDKIDAGDEGGADPDDTVSEDTGQAEGSVSGAEPAGSQSARSPAMGSYVYAQQGYEEFCSGASCDRSDLPRRQAISLKLVGRSAAGDEVLSEIRGPGDRLFQTTTVYSHQKASVTRVYVRMAYEGFVFENEYQPAPPVEILRFPLRAGDSWSGSWKAETSGSYTAQVVGRETISVGGRDVAAFKVSTDTTFRGEFEGTSDAQVWVDPQTRAVLRTSGLLRLKTNLGGYNTAFQTDLVSGPGY